MADETKNVGTKKAESHELRCTQCGNVCEVVDNGEYIAPVSKCCTAYIQEFRIFSCGTTKV